MKQRSFSHLPGALQVPLEVEEEAHSQVAKEAPQDASTIQVKRYDKFHSISSVPKVVVSFLDKVSPPRPRSPIFSEAERRQMTKQEVRGVTNQTNDTTGKMAELAHSRDTSRVLTGLAPRLD